MKQLPTEFSPNTLYSGDCLDVMRGWSPGIADLIYLDPPFNSNADYNIVFGKDNQGRDLDERAQFTAFKDTWRYTETAHLRVQEILADARHPAHSATDGFNRIIPESPMLAYLSYMAERIVEMYVLLRNTGSLYLHCDPSAGHYLKILLDEIFGRAHFRGDIIWQCSPNKNDANKNKFPNRVNNILHYTKTDEYVFNHVFGKLSADHIEKSYRYEDEKGRYMTAPLYSNTMVGGYAKQKVFKFKGLEKRWMNSLSTLKRFDREGRLHHTKSGGIRKKVYLVDSKGTPQSNIWTDIPIATKAERLGYPTQKPIKLLERIISASSNPGDLVLDPFCGCGTAAHASFNLKRKFIGIDISPFAIAKICKERLKQAGLKSPHLQVRGLPTDMQSAMDMDPFMFEQWAITQMTGFEPNDKQVGDGGVDGRATLLHKPAGEKGLIIAQVKQGNLSADAQRAMLSQILGGRASVGIFVTLNKIKKPTPTMQEVQRAAGTYQLPGGTERHPRLQYWSMEEHFAGVKPPLPERARTRAERQGDLMVRA